MIMTFPNSVRSRPLHILSFVCNLSTLWLKLNTLLPLSSYEKWIPKIFTGVCSHFIPRGQDLLFAHFPNHIAFVFFILRSNPEIFPKSPSILRVTLSLRCTVTCGVHACVLWPFKMTYTDITWILWASCYALKVIATYVTLSLRCTRVFYQHSYMWRQCRLPGHPAFLHLHVQSGIYRQRNPVQG